MSAPKIIVHAEVSGKPTLFQKLSVSLTSLFVRRLAAGNIKKNNPFLSLKTEFSPTTLRHPITSGFSGGPLLDDKNEVVGVVHVGCADVRSLFLKSIVPTATIDLSLCCGFRYFRHLSGYFGVKKLFGYTHPSLEKLAVAMYTTLSLAYFTKIYLSKDTFFHFPYQTQLAVHIPQILPKIEEILETESAHY